MQRLIQEGEVNGCGAKKIPGQSRFRMTTHPINNLIMGPVKEQGMKGEEEDVGDEQEVRPRERVESKEVAPQPGGREFLQ